MSMVSLLVAVAVPVRWSWSLAGSPSMLLSLFWVPQFAAVLELLQSMVCLCRHLLGSPLLPVPALGMVLLMPSLVSI